MFRIPRRLKGRPGNRAALPVELRLERLEMRDLPAAPVISSFTAVPTNSGKAVVLSGHVNDEHPAGIMVTFGGVASGMATTDASGNFSVSTTATNLGTVTASAMDNEMLTGTASASFTSQAPTITLSISYRSGKTVTLSGTVTDEDPAGRTVTFGGQVTGTATVQSNGTFSLTTTATALGTVTASVTNVWGQQSNTAQVSITSTAPVISNFTATEGTNNWWTFSGTVTDESAAGLTVQFGGLAALAGRTATVDADGDFELTIKLAPGQLGTATAQVTDWCGLVSNQATAIL